MGEYSGQEQQDWPQAGKCSVSAPTASALPADHATCRGERRTVPILWVVFYFLESAL